MSSSRRHPYMRGYAFWNQNKFWKTIPNLSPAGRQYYENWLDSLKQNDKLLQKSNDL